MEESQSDFSKLGFAKTFVLPALLVFLVPVLSYLFFWHAQHSFDVDARESILQEIRTDPNLTPQERAEAEEFFGSTPFSKLLKNEEFAATVEPEVRFHYATFRWMIWLAAVSIVAGVGVFLLAGLFVLLSMRSQFAQYLSLSAGWHLLRLYAAAQVIVQGVLLVVLSFWVTALWFEFYVPKLIFVIGLLVAVAVFMVIRAMFFKAESELPVEGEVLDQDAAPALWTELRAICSRVGTDPPDQIIAGIDDNFFVTELPVEVGDRTIRGRTLYVSLSLLKQLDGAEADAVLAHEMAHFSGDDTLYSKRISPLLMRYGNYLAALRDNAVTLPIFYFMLCFRAMYELSLSRLSRQREFRADRVAAEGTSHRGLAGSLLRIAAYSTYRNSVEHELFKQEEALESANISERIETGFPAYALSFSSDPAIGNFATTHPFDTHPPLAQRLEAMAVRLSPEQVEEFLSTPGDGRWYANIDDARELERRQWADFEQRFRDYHEQTLPYRFLPETPEEEAVVVKAFPEVAFQGKDGDLVLDHEKIAYSKWDAPLRYCEIKDCAFNNEDGSLRMNRKSGGGQTLKTRKFGHQQQELLEAINRYYSRYLAAMEYQQFKKAEAARAQDGASPMN